MHWSRRWLVGSLLLLLLGIAAGSMFGCGAVEEDADATSDDAAEGADKAASAEESSAEGDEDSAGEPQKRRERAINVSVSEVVEGDLVLPVVAEGSIRARHTAALRFEISGTIQRIWVEEGQRVTRGQRLATLNDREYTVAVEEAHSRYLEALGKLAVEEDQLTGPEDATYELTARIKELEAMARKGEITRDEQLAQEIELGVRAVREGAYKRELLEVRTGLSSARADESRAQINLERTVVRAPFAGVVTRLDLNVGERVQLGQELCQLVDDIDIEAEVGVLESDLGSVVLGRAALVSIPALQQTLSLTVDVIDPQIDPTSRTCRVLLKLRSEDGRVKPGMYVRAAIAGEIMENRVLVPREAILTRDGRPLLFKVEEDRSKWLYVQLGERNDRLVEITRVLQGGPLVAGDLVVVDNHLTLTHEAKVKVTKTIPAADPWTAARLAEAAADQSR